MMSQKLENLLNLSLEATAQQREQSLELPVGVAEDRWELIIKYHGNLGEALERAGLSGAGESQTTPPQQEFFQENLSQSDVQASLQAEYLLPGYAIITATRVEIERLSVLPEIDYVEKPKALYEGEISISQGKLAACIQGVTERPPFLSGRGCLVGIPDSGIDYKNGAFLDGQGRSRILYLWDQTKAADPERGLFPPAGFFHGVEFTKEQLDESIVSGEELTFDRSGHGTGVTAIAAGKEGVAPEAGLLIVKLGSGSGAEGSSRTTELMRAVAWMLQKAQELGEPLAINISYGSTYGSHDGTSLLETFLNNAAESYKAVICVGSGNEGAAAGHAQVILDGEKRVECSIASYQSACYIALWKNYGDVFRLELLSPGGNRLEIPLDRSGKREFTLSGTKILFYQGEPAPYTRLQEFYFDLLGNPYIEEGIWTFVLTPVRIIQGAVSLYLPAAEAVNRGTNFFRPTAAVTMTIPATAQKVITVGAYNPLYQEYADFSGRGYPIGEETAGTGKFYYEQQMKPDICAPGTDILVPDGQGSYAVVSGTSFAAPYVTGSSALLMEWGIVQGNDPYLYGEKVKAYFIKGAKRLPGYTRYPNEMVGWGAVCVENSLPG